MNEITDRETCPLPLPISSRPPSTCEAMFERLLTSQLKGNISARGEVIRQDRTVSKDSIKTFKYFGCYADKRTET